MWLVSALCAASASRLLRSLVAPKQATPVLVRIDATAPHIDDDALRTLSEQVRNADAAALQLRSSRRQLHIVLDEQRCAAADFPGPCPVIYEPGDHDVDDDADACGADAVLLTRHAKAPDSVLAIHRLETVTDVLDLKTPPHCVSLSAAAWDALRTDDSELLRKATVIADLPLGDEPSRRAREMRASGCDCVLIDVTGLEDQIAGLVAAVKSKHSAHFGSLGLKMGFSTFASDQYWVNKDMKEVLARQKKRDAQNGSPSS